MPIKFVSLLADPLHQGLRSLCEASCKLDFQENEKWQDSRRQLESAEVEAGAVCGLLYTLLRAKGVCLMPVAAPLLNHPRYGPKPKYWSDVVVRHDSDMFELNDLRERHWLYNEPLSFSGYRSFLSHLQQNGLTPSFLGEQTATGSHHRSMIRLSKGEGDFSVIDSTFLDFQPLRIRRRLRCIASIGPSPMPLIVATPRVRDEVLKVLQADAQFQTSLGRFQEIGDGDYQAIRDSWNRSLHFQNPKNEQFFMGGELPFVSPPFTSLAQQVGDQKVLRSIGTELRTRLVEEPSERLSSGIGFHLVKHARREHHHYVISPQELKQKNLSLVGFVSQMKPTVDIQALFEVDDLLLNQLSLHQGFLSYSPTEYREGLWANLAVFRSPQARDAWASTSPHMKAIKELGPSSYDNVRLHLGVWPSLTEPMNWVATKYLHYTHSGLWRGVRT